MTAIEPPLGLVAELSHRCPLGCPYCSNPESLDRKPAELTTAQWQSVFEQAAELGVLQLHLTGGEPTVRDDLVDLVATARGLDLYVNLITSGALLDRRRVLDLVDAGVDHVQLSVQSADPDRADAIAGLEGAHARKLLVARWVKENHVPLTINAVLHRDNIHETADLIDLAVELGAGRLELAHAQYHGWALRNRAALMPDADSVRRATSIVRRAQANLDHPLEIDYVAADYYASRPKACMGGWGQSIAVVTPSGDVLPCHAATSMEGFEFDNVLDRDLANIWYTSSAFARFRGTEWMREPCRSCAWRESDWGGCRCQAFALTGDAANTDPTCALATHDVDPARIARELARATPPPLEHRGFSSNLDN